MSSQRNKGRIVDGIIVLDKAKGLSSNYALQNVKKLFEAKKAGHTGSLDPLATGVLPLCFGEATKLSQFLLNSDKAIVSEVHKFVCRPHIELGHTTLTLSLSSYKTAERSNFRCCFK